MMWKPPLGPTLQALPDRSARVPAGSTCMSGHVGLRDNSTQGDSGRQAEAALIFHIVMLPTQVRMDWITPEIMVFVNINESFRALTVDLANLAQETDLLCKISSLKF